MDSAVSKFQKKFSLTPPEAKKILKLFIEEELVDVGFDNQIRMNLLANSTRKKIFELIEDFPGVYISIIRSHLELGTNQTLWHLGFLVEFDYITETKFGKVKAYSVLDCSEEEILVGFLTLKNSLRDILILLNLFPNGISIAQLEETTQKPRSSLYYTLNKLDKWKVIQKTEVSSTQFKINFTHLSIIDDALRKYKEIFRSTIKEDEIIV